jgi:hypothetical protein
LAAALTPSHLGVTSTLVNNYPAMLEHPKAVGIMQRTAELRLPDHATVSPDVRKGGDPGVSRRVIGCRAAPATVVQGGRPVDVAKDDSI